MYIPQYRDQPTSWWVYVHHIINVFRSTFLAYSSHNLFCFMGMKYQSTPNRTYKKKKNKICGTFFATLIIYHLTYTYMYLCNACEVACFAMFELNIAKSSMRMGDARKLSYSNYFKFTYIHIMLWGVLRCIVTKLCNKHWSTVLICDIRFLVKLSADREFVYIL